MKGKASNFRMEIKKAYSFYYFEKLCLIIFRFSSGKTEPQESPLREIYNAFLKDNKERGKFGSFTKLDPSLMLRISLPKLPGENMRRLSIGSSLSTISFDGISNPLPNLSLI